MQQFLWTPGTGVDPLALGRLRSHFPRPAETMGEAWLIGDERRMFDALLGDLDQMTTCELQQPLEEIASGTSAFGPQKEWNTWYWRAAVGDLHPGNCQRRGIEGGARVFHRTAIVGLAGQHTGRSVSGGGIGRDCFDVRDTLCSAQRHLNDLGRRGRTLELPQPVHGNFPAVAAHLV